MANIALFLIQQPEHPQWYPIPEAGFAVVDGEEAVWNVFYLFESLVLAANFKNVCAIYLEVALVGIGNFVRFIQLVDKKCFANSANFCTARHRVQEIGIFEIQFFGL